ncbi:MAG: hypothetical protein E7335_00785 [Clostridiales bacterium]|nr:hypothetical protein [Clostridiales bacterium]
MNFADNPLEKENCACNRGNFEQGNGDGCSDKRDYIFFGHCGVNRYDVLFYPHEYDAEYSDNADDNSPGFFFAISLIAHIVKHPLDLEMAQEEIPTPQ